MDKNMKKKIMLNCTKNILQSVANDPIVELDNSIEWKRVSGVVFVSVLVAGAIVAIPVGAPVAILKSIGGGVTFFSAYAKRNLLSPNGDIKIPVELIDAISLLFKKVKDEGLASLLATENFLDVNEIKQKYGVTLNKVLYSVYLLLWSGYKVYKGTVEAYIAKTKMELKMEGGVC